MKTSRSLLILALLGASLLVADRARAAGASYEDTIANALKEYRAGNFGEARVLFEEAHRMDANARTFRGLGITAFELRMYVEAIAELTAALDDSKRPLTGAQAKQAVELIERARTYVTRIELKLTPGDAAVEVDGKPIELPADHRIMLDPGPHSLTVRANGYREQSIPLELTSGQARTLVVQLAAPEGSAPALAALASNANASAVARGDGARASTRSPALRTFFWVAAGGAVAFSGAVLALHFIAKHEADRIERACPVEPAPLCSPAELDRKIDGSHIETYNALMTGGVMAAGVSAAAAIALIALDLHDSRRAFSMRVGPAAASVRVRF